MIEAPTSKSFAGGRRGRARDARRLRASPLTWLNVVCLDAPLVAIAWQWAFARSFGAAVNGGATVALFLTAWLIYLADRFGDSVSIDLRLSTALRQRFCLRHRKAWLAGIAIVAIADVWVIAAALDARQFAAGAVVGACAVGYLALNRLRPTVWCVVPAKEVSIGLLFAAGAMVPLAGELTRPMLGPWLLFAWVCALNCICIAAWERYLDLAQQRVSIATAFPVIGFAVVPALVVVFAVSAGLALSGHDHREVYWCLAASAALLALLHLLGRRIAQDVRTALADVALLTPVFAVLLR
jgi:hypothetical protein